MKVSNPDFGVYNRCSVDSIYLFADLYFLSLFNTCLPGTRKRNESKILRQIWHLRHQLRGGISVAPWNCHILNWQLCRKAVVFLPQPTSKSRWSEGGMGTGPQSPGELWRFHLLSSYVPSVSATSLATPPVNPQIGFTCEVNNIPMFAFLMDLGWSWR